MKKNRVGFIAPIICCTIIGFLLAGCAMFDKKDDEPKKEGYVAPTDGLKNCKTSEEAGKKMVESIYLGLSTENYELYSRDFTDKHKKYFSKVNFDHAREAVKDILGDYKEMKFIGFWKKGNYDILLWKARFSETDDDVLIQMYVTKVDGTYKIAALKLI
jgi:hypothetical protein